MTLTKIALTVFGTVGLTAGTVLAVAEPSPTPLPETAVAAGPCSSCPSRSCGTAKCFSTTVSACANAAATETCTVKGEPATACKSGTSCDKTDPQGSAVGFVENDEKCIRCAADDSGRPSLFETAVSLALRKSIAASVANAGGELAGAAAHADGGCIVQACCESAAACAEAAPPCDANACCAGGVCTAAGECPAGACCKESCEAATCEAATCGVERAAVRHDHKRRLTLRFGLSSNGPLFQLTSGTDAATASAKVDSAAEPGEACDRCTACPAEGCDEAKCDGGSCKSCPAGEAIATAADETTAPCAAGCPGSAADEAVCNGEACTASKCPSCSAGGCAGCKIVDALSVATEPACSIEACDCHDCCCETCDCVTDAACPPGMICPVAARLQEILNPAVSVHSFAWRTWPAGPASDSSGPSADGDFADAATSPVAAGAEAPGWVRLTNVASAAPWSPAPVSYLPPGAGPLPGRLFDFVAAHPAIACNAHPGATTTWPALRGVSFEARPTARDEATEPAGSGIEGRWSRTAGDTTIAFVIDGDRIRGTCGDDVAFSGTCSVSRDGQVFGVLDELRYAGDQPAALVTAQGLVDQPFAFRFTVDRGDLIVKDLRCGGASTAIDVNGANVPLADYIAAVACGRFERTE